MAKFHINAKGVPAICKATKGNCPFGGSTGMENHFDTIEDAQQAIDGLNSSEFGLLADTYAGIIKSSNNLSGYVDKFTKGYKDINEFEDFYDMVLEHKDFKEFARKHGSTIAKHNKFNNSKKIAEEANEMFKTIHYHNSSQNLYELSKENAIEIIRNNIEPSYLDGWFRQYDSNYKPKIENSLITNPELRNASLNISHQLYLETSGNQVSFDDFLEMEIDVYRGGNFDFIKNDVFVSYSFNKDIAESFNNKSNNNLIKRKIKIRDTLGSLQTTGEAEIMIRN